ncbi:MAG: hypothetical protein IJ714_08440 [Bacteroidales bacterium]|nr:hypothetical protein [Bacteroidales bacterium]
MKFKKIIPYKLRRALSMATIAGATLLPTSCKKDEPAVEQHDVEIVFSHMTADELLTFDILKKHANDKSVKNVYLVPTGHWDSIRSHNIIGIREKFFQPRMEISPKIRGRGDFDFKLGEASKVPSDSLWFVQQGWTINKKYQNQK